MILEPECGVLQMLELVVVEEEALQRCQVGEGPSVDVRDLISTQTENFESSKAVKGSFLHSCQEISGQDQVLQIPEGVKGPAGDTGQSIVLQREGPKLMLILEAARENLLDLIRSQ